MVDPGYTCTRVPGYRPSALGALVCHGTRGYNLWYLFPTTAPTAGSLGNWVGIRWDKVPAVTATWYKRPNSVSAGTWVQNGEKGMRVSTERTEDSHISYEPQQSPLLSFSNHCVVHRFFSEKQLVCIICFKSVAWKMAGRTMRAMLTHGKALDTNGDLKLTDQGRDQTTFFIRECIVNGQIVLPAFESPFHVELLHGEQTKIIAVCETIDILREKLAPKAGGFGTNQIEITVLSPDSPDSTKSSRAGFLHLWDAETGDLLFAPWKYTVSQDWFSGHQETWTKILLPHAAAVQQSKDYVRVLSVGAWEG
eukprot:1600539-Rhodomonas_salina.1